MLLWNLFKHHQSPKSSSLSSLLLARIMGSTTTNNSGCHDPHITFADAETRESRLRAALWSLFAGDALAAPTHWYYGGRLQIQKDYGPDGIQDYTKPVFHLAGSILNKSNLNGGGRATTKTGANNHSNNNQGTKNNAATGLPPSIIGYVINHGKEDLWNPSRQIHYHATLEAGENTLEASLVRVLMKSMAKTGDGTFDADTFRQDYMDFMMKAGSHNDTYASTCHRMFFRNLIFEGQSPENCPDNDRHNVDTIDGLVLPTVVSLTYAAAATTKAPSGDNNDDDNNIGQQQQQQQQQFLQEQRLAARRAAAACAAVTRNSHVLETAASAWSDFLFDIVVSMPLTTKEKDDQQQQKQQWHEDNNDDDETILLAAAKRVALQSGLRPSQIITGRGRRDQLTACYLGDSLPSLLNSVVKYSTPSSSSSATSTSSVNVWNALLANANLGGENVHRGACLGAILGAMAGMQPSDGQEQPPVRITNLFHRAELANEIDSFITAVMK